MGEWNHNIHYHNVVLKAVPAGCERALDAGCGTGLLARQLARQCGEVTALDADHETLVRGMAAGDGDSRVSFVEGDVMTYPFGDAGFDMITAVATLHHLPLRPALRRFQSLLKPGGVLAVVGLYRTESVPDYAWAAAAIPTSWILHRLRDSAAVAAPLQEPRETLREIRVACDAVLPGGLFRRLLLFRYSFVWRKP